MLLHALQMPSSSDLISNIEQTTINLTGLWYDSTGVDFSWNSSGRGSQRSHEQYSMPSLHTYSQIMTNEASMKHAMRTLSSLSLHTTRSLIVILGHLCLWAVDKEMHPVL